MHNIGAAIKGALEAITPLQVVGLYDSLQLAGASDQTLYLSIESITKIENSSAHATTNGTPYGAAYRVAYDIAILASHLFTSNTLSQLLQLGIAGASHHAYRDSVEIENKTYHIMRLHCQSEIIYPVASDQDDSRRINEVIVALAGYQPITLTNQ
jgi:hypothetical protein